MAKKTGNLKAKATPKHEPEVARANAAKAKATTKPVAKGATAAAGVNPDARIVVLPAGKENPRKPGSARRTRYEDLRKSATVGDFLKKHPRRNSTIARAVIAKLIELQ